MIFFTLGTHQPFDRMVKMVDTWCSRNPSAELLGQLPNPGRHGYKPKHFAWVTQLHPDEYTRTIERSAFVVAHAGMGTIITALCLCKPILILPRLAALQEQRNDHQTATARRLQAMPGITAAFTEDQFHAAFDRLYAAEPTAAGTPLGTFAQHELTDRLRLEILASARRDTARIGAGSGVGRGGKIGGVVRP